MKGVWIDPGVVYFATTGDEGVWSLSLGREGAPDLLETVYDGRTRSNGPRPLRGAPFWDPDKVAVSPAGEVFVSEDAGGLRISPITQPGDRPAAHHAVPPGGPCRPRGSELTGPCFDPSGSRLYFRCQRGGFAGQGITYEITGPFATTDVSGSDAFRPDAALGRDAAAARHPSHAGLGRDGSRPPLLST